MHLDPTYMQIRRRAALKLFGLLLDAHIAGVWAFGSNNGMREKVHLLSTSIVDARCMTGECRRLGLRVRQGGLGR